MTTEITENEINLLKNKVSKYLSIDDKIKKLTLELREAKKEKLLMSNDVLNLMSDYNIEDLNTKSGKLKYTISKTKKAVSKIIKIRTDGF